MSFTIKMLTDNVTALKTAIAAQDSADAAIHSIENEIADAQQHVTDLTTRRDAAAQDQGGAKSTLVGAVDSLISVLTDYRDALAPPAPPEQAGS